MSVHSVPLSMQVVIEWVEWYVNWFLNEIEYGSFENPIDLTGDDTSMSSFEDSNDIMGGDEDSLAASEEELEDL